MMGIAYADLILRILELLAPALVRESAEFANMRLMVAEGRDPAPEDWDALFTALRSEGDRLRAAVAQLEARRDAGLI
jgi:hypothetical protein